MKYVVVVLNDQGLSSIVEVRELTGSALPQKLASVADISDDHVRLRPRRIVGTDRSHYMALDVPSRGTRFALCHFEASMADGAMHHTDSVDFDVVVQGEIELTVEDGSVWLEVGDSICIPGLAHGWRTKTVGTLAVMVTDLRTL